MIRLPTQQRDLFTRRWRRQRLPHVSELNALHIPLVSLLRLALRPEIVMAHVPNGEHRDLRTAQKLKAMGVRAGFSDLVFFYPPAKVLFLELKKIRGRLSEAQLAFQSDVRMAGFEYHCVDNVADALALLQARHMIRPGVAVR